MKQDIPKTCIIQSLDKEKKKSRGQSREGTCKTLCIFLCLWPPKPSGIYSYFHKGLDILLNYTLFLEIPLK